MKTSNSVVFVVAHPDDVAFSFGGTAWMLKEKHQLHVLCASQGERGYHSEWKGPGLKPPSAETAARRAQEEQSACDLLGAELTFLGQMDGEISPHREVCEKVREVLSALQPRAVFTHGPFDKPDHSATFGITYLALHATGRFWETELYTEEAYNLTRVSVFVNITDAIEGKKQQIRCHRSHMRRSEEEEIDAILERNRVLGGMSVCPYAEGFLTPFPITNSRWGRPAESGRILLELV
jgi:LmbE family N-acetylglucosaminyl deacetylase